MNASQNASTHVINVEGISQNNFPIVSLCPNAVVVLCPPQIITIVMSAKEKCCMDRRN